MVSSSVSTFRVDPDYVSNVGLVTKTLCTTNGRFDWRRAQWYGYGPCDQEGSVVSGEDPYILSNLLSHQAWPYRPWMLASTAVVPGEHVACACLIAIAYYWHMFVKYSDLNRSVFRYEVTGICLSSWGVPI